MIENQPDSVERHTPSAAGKMHLASSATSHSSATTAVQAGHKPNHHHLHPDIARGHMDNSGHHSLLDKLSIKSSSDAASNAESTASAPAIVEKVRKVKRKMKDKLHIGSHHSDDEDEGDDDDDDDTTFGSREDDLPLATVRDRARTSSSSNTAEQNARATLAQQYAEEHRIADGTPDTNSPRSSGLATPLGGADQDSDDDDDGNIIVLQSGNNKSAPDLLSRGSNGQATPGGSIRAGVKSPPGTNYTTASGSVSPSRHRARSSVSLPPSQSDWRRRAEFHNYFEGKVDEEEHLVSDYTCAWAKDILRHGRLYVGARNMAFICTIIGLKCSVVIPFDDIAKIEKSVTARVIPNAITVTTTGGDHYLFSSFVYRDSTYDLIVDCWRSKNPNAYEEYMATQEHHAEAEIEAKEEEQGDKTVSKETFPTESDKPATSHEAHEATECSGNHFSETVLDVRFPSEPEKIFNLLYTSSEFQQQLNTDMKLTDYDVTSWEATAASSNGLRKRDCSYVKPLNGSIGPSSAKCVIVEEELAKDQTKAFEVLSITRTPDVPSGGSFSVHTKTCLTWAGGAKGGCRMLVTTECVWTGRSMIKGVITSSSIAGQRAYNKDVAKLIRKHIQAHPDEFGSTDINAPEADDELSPAVEQVKANGEIAANGTSASAAGRPTGMFRSLVASLQQSEGATTLLLASNILILLFFLIQLFRSGFSSGSAKKVHITKTVLSEQAEKLALQRLLKLENAWAGFQQCVDNMVNESS